MPGIIMRAIMAFVSIISLVSEEKLMVSTLTELVRMAIFSGEVEAVAVFVRRFRIGA